MITSLSFVFRVISWSWSWYWSCHRKAEQLWRVWEVMSDCSALFCTSVISLYPALVHLPFTFCCFTPSVFRPFFQHPFEGPLAAITWLFCCLGWSLYRLCRPGYVHFIPLFKALFIFSQIGRIRELWLPHMFGLRRSSENGQGNDRRTFQLTWPFAKVICFLETILSQSNFFFFF